MTIRLHPATCLISRATKPRLRSIPRPWVFIPLRDRLCVVRWSNGDGSADVVQISVRASTRRI